MEIKIQYIWHDCFVVYLPEMTLVTDYWMDASSTGAQPEDFPRFLDEIPQDKPLYVLVSHHHKDHFARSIFRWESRFPLIHFIISADTAKSISYMLKPGSTYKGIYKPGPGKVTVLKPGESFSAGGLRILAFPSTDTGNSYLIEVQDKKIFHAGDLNAWIWKDESTRAEVAAAIRDYKLILERIKEVTEEIDVAFFPVDSRIGTDWCEGAAIFVRVFKVEYFIPMHFTLATPGHTILDRIADAVSFDNYRNPSRGRYLPLTVPCQSVTLSLPPGKKP